jgi:hypothetical protein
MVCWFAALNNSRAYAENDIDRPSIGLLMTPCRSLIDLPLSQINQTSKINESFSELGKFRRQSGMCGNVRLTSLLGWSL